MPDCSISAVTNTTAFYPVFRLCRFPNALPGCCGARLYKWVKKYAKVNASATPKGKLLLGMTGTLSDSLVPVFIGNEALLKGKVLLIANSKYRIAGIDQQAIRLTFEDGKVIFGRKLRWARMKPGAYIQLIGTLLVPINRAGKLNRRDRDSVLFWLLIRGHFEMGREWVKSCSGDEAGRKLLLSIIDDWQQAAAEVEGRKPVEPDR